MDLSDKTPDELKAMGIDAIIEAVLEDVRIDASLPIERDKYGNAIRQLRSAEDAYGKVIEERTIRWTYYDAKEGTVNEIITEDAKEQAIVKHTLDGKQPTLRKVLIAEPVEPIER